MIKYTQELETRLKRNLLELRDDPLDLYMLVKEKYELVFH